MTATWAPPASDVNNALLSISPGPLAAAVLGRVVGMLAARADCPIDRLDDALLITDAIAAHAPAHSIDGRVRVTITAKTGELSIVVATLKSGGADELLTASALPGVGSVLERVADNVTQHPARDGSADELTIVLGFSSGARNDGAGQEDSDAA